MVTALFADIKGSMELMEDLDPEEARAIIDPALKLMIDGNQAAQVDFLNPHLTVNVLKVPESERLICARCKGEMAPTVCLCAAYNFIGFADDTGGKFGSVFEIAVQTSNMVSRSGLIFGADIVWQHAVQSTVVDKGLCTIEVGLGESMRIFKDITPSAARYVEIQS